MNECIIVTADSPKALQKEVNKLLTKDFVLTFGPRFAEGIWFATVESFEIHEDIDEDDE